MGMLSLAGIVSGAGAGAGKSLRQAQTYLNWEMLQEERGKLELQRDERVNDNIIAREGRAHTAMLEEEKRLENKRYSPDTIQKEADRQAAIIEATHAQWRKDQPFVKEQAEANLAAALAGVEGQQKIELAKIQGPGADKLRAAARDISKATQTQALEDIASRAEWLTDPKNKQVLINLQAVAKASYTELDQYSVDKAEWEKTHRDQIYARDISDKNITHLQAAATGIEREIGHIEKTLTGATDPGQIQSLSKRLRYLEKEDSLLTGRIMKAVGIKIEPFDMPVPEPKDTAKPTVGTQSKVLGHVGEAAKRRAGAVGEAVSPALEKAMEVVRSSGMFSVIPITGMVMDVPAVSK